MIQHVHGGSEQHTLIGLASAPGDDFGQIGLSYTRIADDTHAGAVAQEVEIKQPQDAGF